MDLTKNTKRHTVSILIPCWNEEASIASCVQSCLNQSVGVDQIVVIDDQSSDRSGEILKSFGRKIKYVRVAKRLGNKSYVQEFGLKFIKGDIVVATDGDTILDKNFVKNILQEFETPHVVAVAGYVASLKNNWLTRCRAFEYTMSQNIHKLAQSYIGYMFVIPGAAGAFKTEVFRKYLTFDHDTITEDLDFTYKLHEQDLRIAYARNAIVYTQDPITLHAYTNQMRRWLGGGWQNLLKHKTLDMKPAQALEISLIYIEGIVFASLLFIVPLVNIRFTFFLLAYYFVVALALSIWCAFREKRADLVLAVFPYMFLVYLNAYIFLEQMIREVFLKRKNLIWFQPERVNI